MKKFFRTRYRAVKNKNKTPLRRSFLIAPVIAAECMKKILITGARQGMGRDYGFELARRGHEVLATTETELQAKELRLEAEERGLKLNIAKLDIREAADYEQVVEFEPDVLINNAAIGESGPLAEIPMERLRANFETNVHGTIALTQEVLKGMIERENGRVIIISSVGGKIVLPYLGAYNMTKFALEAAADAFRQELSHHGIKISVVEPGAIDTGFNERMIATKYKWFDEKDRLHSDIKRIRKFEIGLITDQHPTDPITKTIIHAVESSKPKTRYISPFINYGPIIKFALAMPDRFRDWLVRKVNSVK